jgi:hypothetical protein
MQVGLKLFAETFPPLDWYGRRHRRRPSSADPRRRMRRDPTSHALTPVGCVTPDLVDTIAIPDLPALRQC